MWEMNTLKLYCNKSRKSNKKEKSVKNKKNN